MQIGVSVFALLAGAAILTAPNFMFDHGFDGGLQKVAAGWVGAVIGYWLS